MSGVLGFLMRMVLRFRKFWLNFTVLKGCLKLGNANKTIENVMLSVMLNTLKAKQICKML